MYVSRFIIIYLNIDKKKITDKNDYYFSIERVHLNGIIVNINI
jgi:hypothetical protein